MTEQEEKPALASPMIKALQDDANAMTAARSAVRERNKWGRVRQDTLMDRASELPDYEAMGLDPEMGTRALARKFFDRPLGTPVKQRWSVHTRAELTKWLEAQNEKPLPGISAQARRFCGAPATAAVRVNGDRFAVYVAKEPEGIQDFAPPPDDPFTQNMYAVWLVDGESPAEDPEI